MFPRLPSFVSVASAALLLTGCPEKTGDGPAPLTSPSLISPSPEAPRPAAPAATSASAAVSSAPATAAPSTSGAAAPDRPKPNVPRSFEQLQKELEKKCPAKLDGNNQEMKMETAKAVECIRRKMIADLDAVLLPLKKSDPERFKALMKEQADWNRYIESACYLEEERFWVDFTTGERNDGTMRGYPFLGCMDKGITERTLYARSLAAADPTAIEKRILAAQKDGAAVKKIVAEIRAKAEGFAKTPPPRKPDAFAEADWAKIATESAAMEKRTGSLAASTCEGWPELAKALGGKAACTAKAELYYFVQGSSPEVGQ